MFFFFFFFGLITASGPFKNSFKQLCNNVDSTLIPRQYIESTLALFQCCVAAGIEVINISYVKYNYKFARGCIVHLRGWVYIFLHFYEAVNFCNFLFAFLYTKSLLKMVLSQQEQIFSFYSRPFIEGR